jgi:hypothetical protein
MAIVSVRFWGNRSFAMFQSASTAVEGMPVDDTFPVAAWTDPFIFKVPEAS